MVKRNLDKKILDQIQNYKNVLKKNRIKVQKLILSPFAENLKRKFENECEEFSASEGFRSRRSKGRRYPERKLEGASFGSYARGTQKKWSDIDLCVVSPQFGKNRFEERVRLMRLSIEGGENIEPHPYNLNNLKDLNNKWDPLASEINKFGVEIPL